MNVERLHDTDELRSFLINDRLASAYLLGNLDPAYFQWCKVFGTRDPQAHLNSLVMIYSGLSLPVVFTAGNEQATSDLFTEKKVPFPERFQFHVSGNQLQEIEKHFPLSSKRKMIRMGLHRENYRPGASDTSHVRKLGHRDTASIIDLYHHYPDNLFEAYQLETGYYYGIPDPDDPHGSLISIAGIHVFSEINDIALIGNFVTRPDHQGEGLSTACTSTLLDALLQKVSYVALNVPDGNEPALRLFEKFGFAVNNEFHEGVVNVYN